MQAVCGAWRVGCARAMGDRVRIVLDRAGLQNVSVKGAEARPSPHAWFVGTNEDGRGVLVL